MNKINLTRFYLFPALVWFFVMHVSGQKEWKVGPLPDSSILVPSNQLLRPAGKQVYFPGRPVDLALSPDNHMLFVKNIKSLEVEW